MKLDRPNDDRCNNSDGDDTDYESEENKEETKPPVAGGFQLPERPGPPQQRASTLTKEDPLKNQLLIKKKFNTSIPAQKKKK